jgi:hypothetical protein
MNDNSLLEDHLARMLRQVHKALAIPQALLESPALTAPQIEMSMQSYLSSLKAQGLIQDSNVPIADRYTIERYHLTKHGYVIEHHRSLLTQIRSQHSSDSWLVRGLQGPHKPRRLLRQRAKQLLGGEHILASVNFVPVRPIDYINVTINVEPLEE